MIAFYSGRAEGRSRLATSTKPVASHFAPEQLEQALQAYRRSFRPSRWRTDPYAMIGVPLVTAETDRDAHRLATTVYQRFLQLIRDEPLFKPPARRKHGRPLESPGTGPRRAQTRNRHRRRPRDREAKTRRPLQ